MKVVLDSGGIEQVLKSEGVAAAVNSAAQSIAAQAQAARPDITVETGSGTTDRAVASVTLAHPKGLAVQAKHGTLTRAAAAAGLEVKG